MHLGILVRLINVVRFISASVPLIAFQSSRSLFRYNIPEQCRLDLTETDIKFAKSLLEKVNLVVFLHAAVSTRGTIWN
jgi:hypothetical protein